MIVVAFIFLNLFVAIILDGYYKAEQNAKTLNFELSIELFQQTWKKYDTEATGFIKVDDLPMVIMDLLIEEFKEMDRPASIRSSSKDVVFFNIHTHKYAVLFLKW